MRAELGKRDVHVWATELDAGPAVVDSYLRLLSPDEIARARRFRFDRDRDRYVVGRGWLRALLASYLGVEPSSLRFSYSRYGKPDLLQPSRPLSFNLSHSGGFAVGAVCPGAEIGVDVELLQPEPARERVPEHFFSPDEVRTLRSLPEAQQSEAFFRCWTRKEAFIKARGDGMSLALDSFDVTLRAEDSPRLLRTAWDAGEAACWTLHDVSDSFPGYVASLAVRGSGWAVTVESTLSIVHSDATWTGASRTIASGAESMCGP